MQRQRGFIFLVPALLINVLISPSLADATLGSLMIGLSFIALLCNLLGKGRTTV